MPFKLVYYSQQDPQWKTDILGFGEAGDTIGYVGCALTSAAMLLSGHGYTETPKTLNQKLKNINGFAGAAIRWGSVSQLYPQVTVKSIIPCTTSDAPLGTIDAALAAGQPAIVMVDSSPASGLQTHWVVLYAKKGDDYLMLDPWPYQTDVTKETYLMPRYSQGEPLQRSIMYIILYDCLTTSGPIAIPGSASGSPDVGVPTGNVARVKADVTWGLNIRTSEDTSSMNNVVVTVPAGTQLTVLDADGMSKIGAVNQWIRVRDAQGHAGLAAAWYLENVPGTTVTPSTGSTTGPASGSSTSTSTPDSQKLIVLVKSGGAKVYQAASSTSTVISTEKAGARLVVVEAASGAMSKIGVAGKWLNIKATNNKRGFIDGGSVKQK